MRLLAGVYALFARLFPPGLRSHYGPEMVDAFASEVERRFEQDGSGSALRFTAAATLDVVAAGLGARFRTLHRSEAAARPRSVRWTTRNGGWIEDGWLDVRFAVRGLSRNRTFTVVAATTMAIGMAGAASMLSVADGLLFRQDNVVEPSRMVTIWEIRSSTTSSAEGVWLPHSRYEAYRDATRDVFDGLAGHAYGRRSVGTDLGAVPVDGFVTTGNYFQVLGVTPGLGRLYDDEYEASVVLSDRLWRNTFGADPEIVGRVLSIDRRPFTVVGVAAPGFTGTMAAFSGDLWIPWGGSRQPTDADSGGAWLALIGRLAEGIDRDLAEARVAEVARSIPPVSSGIEVRGARFEGLLWRDDIGGVVRTGILMMFGAAALLLLIACANIGAMILARSHDRRRELAVRRAIGAGSGRLMRQMLTESMLLALLGGAAGIVVAGAATAALSSIRFPVDVTISLDLTPDRRVLLVSFLLTALTGVLFGLGPALSSAKTDLAMSLKEGAQGRRSRLRNGAFVATQLAVSTVLLLTAGLLVRSFGKVADVPLGFDPSGVLTAEVSVIGHGYTEEEYRLFFSRLVERARQVPGVEAAGLGAFVLLGGANANNRARPTEWDDDAPSVTVGRNVVDPGYFRANRIQLVAGRFFTEADVEGAPRVAVINERLAERFWPNQSPLGRTFRRGGTTEYTVVGVVRDGVYVFPYEDPLPFSYYAYSQFFGPEQALHVRAAGDLGEVRGAVAEVLRDLDPNIAPSFRTMDEVVAWGRLGPRFMASFSSVFALVGLLLSAVGVYGLLAVHVTRREREFGVRMAVGASARRVLLLVVGRGAVLALVGCGVGLAASLGAGRIVSSLLYDISPFDVATFVLVPLVLLSAVLAASSIPARRATRASTVALLREE